MAEIPLRLRGSFTPENVPLRKRDIHILQGLASGKTYAQVAGELNLSVNTIKCDLRLLRDKIRAKNSVHAVYLLRDRIDAESRSAAA